MQKHIIIISHQICFSCHAQKWIDLPERCTLCDNLYWIYLLSKAKSCLNSATSTTEKASHQSFAPYFHQFFFISVLILIWLSLYYNSITADCFMDSYPGMFSDVMWLLCNCLSDNYKFLMLQGFNMPMLSIVLVMANNNLNEFAIKSKDICGTLWHPE